MSSTGRNVDEALRQLQAATKAKKCWSCNCFHGTLQALERDLPIDLRRPDLADALRAAQAVLQPVRYECLGCDPCHPPQAMDALGLAGETCEAAPVDARDGWPPLPGSYQVIRYSASVAVCTLTDDELVQRIMAVGSPHLAVVGSMQTENLGIERLIINLVANPNIRFLILCGEDTRKAIGHLPGASLLALSSFGMDEAGRIQGAPGKRPVLKNIQREAVEHFRRTITVIDRIGCVDPTAILAEAAACAARNPGPAAPCASVRSVETIVGHIPERMVSDPSGYVVIDVDRGSRQLVLEHYATTGVLDVIVRGATANEVMTPVMERQLISRLDHAGYLGKELARAERALADGQPYVQDAAPEQGAQVAVLPASGTTCGSACGCSAGPGITTQAIAAPTACGSSSSSTCCPPVKGTPMSLGSRMAIIIGVLGVAAAAVISLRMVQTKPGLGAPATPVVPIETSTLAPLTVSAFMKGIDQHRGPSVVLGVVNAVQPEQHLLSLVDDADAGCTEGGCCAPLTLPVRWSGPDPAPALGNPVTVRGQVEDAGGKLVFVASGMALRQQSAP